MRSDSDLALLNSNPTKMQITAVVLLPCANIRRFTTLGVNSPSLSATHGDSKILDLEQEFAYVVSFRLPDE